jgi:hypothetical protein
MKVKLPDNINFMVPKSEKSFIGNLPIGSYIPLTDKNAIIGINWKQADGARDLDLSYVDIDDKKTGWNSDYTNDGNTIIYSGDMTLANPEATELLYAKEGKFLPGIVKVNLYNGNDNSKFKFFVATEDYEKMSLK